MTKMYVICSILGLCLMSFLNSCGQAQVDSAQTSPMQATPAYKRVLIQEPARSDDPLHLLIPAIHVDTAIEPVGVLSSGNMDTPRNNPWEDTGWYKDGPRPGERGSAVLDGHLDRPGGAPAVFWNLTRLKVGDEVIVTTSENKVLHYQVTGSAQYPPQRAPLQDIFGNTDGYHLNLITCAGYWLPSEQQTSLRTVVYTVLK
ncbi:MAG: class F sortase [Ktedonobacteraceae bacterium]